MFAYPLRAVGWFALLRSLCACFQLLTANGATHSKHIEIKINAFAVSLSMIHPLAFSHSFIVALLAEVCAVYRVTVNLVTVLGAIKTLS